MINNEKPSDPALLIIGVFLIKLIIWDLDDTLWRGTLAEGDDVELIERRAQLVRDLNQHGVVSSICSKNEAACARAKLTAFGLWDEFVFAKIAFAPKPQAIVNLLAEMQLRAADTLFVDDNPVNLREAQFALPELNVLNISEPGSDEILESILIDQPPSRNRLNEYRILQQKHQDRIATESLSDEEFLLSCEIRACAPAMMANLDFIDRIVELINRSNQLNYTKSRTTENALRNDLTSYYGKFYCWSVFVEDKYGDHGLVGFVMINRRSLQFRHFVFSCRIMHMGVENFALRMVKRFFPGTLAPEDWIERFGTSDANWISEHSYEDPAVRLRLFASQQVEVSSKPQIRIMCACQSGGLAHFSELRAQIDFDIWPRLFELKKFNGSSIQDEIFPPYLIYGAGIDYKDEAWGDLAHRLDQGMYQSCLDRMCDHLEKLGTKMLVILPPETLHPHQYGPDGLNLERTINFNALWRSAAQKYTSITTLDVQEVFSPAEVVDVNHHRPAALKAIAHWIDVWYLDLSRS
jgi:FkbH-like protein